VKTTEEIIRKKSDKRNDDFEEVWKLNESAESISFFNTPGKVINKNKHYKKDNPKDRIENGKNLI